jgi:hypothetical protein
MKKFLHIFKNVYGKKLSWEQILQKYQKQSAAELCQALFKLGLANFTK